jgi:GNAT superfamily N-acetyltransferase
MTRRLASITLDNLDDLPTQCRSCVFWELDPAADRRACESGDPALEKEAWVSDTLLGWGSCGQICYVDGVAAGYVLYAPPAYVPRSAAFATSPVSADAVLLMTARLRPEYRGIGLGRMLVQGVAREVSQRGGKAIEAFGAAGDGVGGEPDPEGRHSPARRNGVCLLPAGYLLAVGFKTVRAHPRVPRLRLEIKSTISWKEDVESALERLFGSIQAPALAPG